ncbi:MutS-related protein [Parasediminibacterium sp. JCM 36343]|uniref:MutS-related protein n=1 Tax=Parasediminibacterium sp. JCM 36343 TaxID=3374279 RepID=UPI00397A1772
MKDMAAAQVYEQQLETHFKKLAGLNNTKTRLAWGRFLCVAITVGLAYLAFPFSFATGCIIILLGIALFLILVAKDAKNSKAIAHTEILVQVNKEELKIMQHQYLHRENGISFSPALHGYANDLDLFGPASLYQYVNRCSTQQGKALLAANLLSALGNKAIAARHEAIKELASNVQWRQQLQAIGQQEAVTIATQQKIKDWLQDTQALFQENYWKFVLPMYATFTLGAILLNILGLFATYQLSLLLACCLVFAFWQSKKVMKPYEQLSKIVAETSVLAALVTLIEDAPFSTATLKALQQQLIHNNTKASVEIGALKSILQRFDLRLNTYLFLVLNTVFLWDVWQARALNAWKRDNKHFITHWFEAIAEMEVINSLSILSFNHPNWCFPNIADNYFTLEATNAGHPLINPDKSVANSFSTHGTGKISLITGSNMAGKSTFLRSIGCNMVLALIGSPVCAEAFTVANARLLSSMRIADNLAESTSTFYAELKKLRSIIEAVNQKEKVLILLDEILRGTNSLDRHTGSKALIKQFIAQNTVAILATHDVALAAEESNYPQNIANYHFDAQVDGEELYFDYKLKAGVCTSLNASILMRKIGIEMG